MRRDSSFCAKCVRYNIYTIGTPYACPILKSSQEYNEVDFLSWDIEPRWTDHRIWHRGLRDLDVWEMAIWWPKSYFQILTSLLFYKIWILIRLQFNPWNLSKRPQLHIAVNIFVKTTQSPVTAENTDTRKAEVLKALYWKSRSLKTTSTTYCRRFDSSCSHQCIANWTAVILLQVLTVTQEKSAVKNEKREGLFR